MNHDDEGPLDFVAGHCACTAVAFVLDLSPAEAEQRDDSHLPDQDQHPESSSTSPSSSTIHKSRKPAGLTLAAACHCTKCQRLNGAPFVWTTHWKEDSVQWFPPPEQRQTDDLDLDSLSLGQNDDEEEKEEEEVTPNDRGNQNEVQDSDSTSNSSSSTTSSTSSASESSSSSGESSIEGPRFSPSLDTYESMPGRKWKLRCKVCGSPMGSWNEFKKEWTIWPSTLERTGPENEEASPAMQLLKPLDHQFYGPWRMMDVNDDLPKWQGYPGNSERVA